MPHDIAATGVIDSAGNIFSIALKCRNNIQRGAICEVSSPDRATVDHDRRTIQAAHCDQAAGHIFVAAWNRHKAVVPLRVHDRFDRVSDQVSGWERVAHAIGAHRDAIADTDRIEPHPHHPCSHRTLTDFGCKLVEVHVAGVAVVPHACNSDLRLVEVGRLEASAQEHCLRGPLGSWLGDSGAVTVQNGHGFNS